MMLLPSASNCNRSGSSVSDHVTSDGGTTPCCQGFKPRPPLGTVHEEVILWPTLTDVELGHTTLDTSFLLLSEIMLSYVN